MAESLFKLGTLVAEGALSPTELTIVEDFLSKMKNCTSTALSTSFSEHSTNLISRFPPEILEHILHFLPPGDLKSAVAVCKNWNKIGGEPKLWPWAKISLEPDSTGPAFDFIKSTRGVRSLEATSLSTEETSYLMSSLAECTHLKELQLEDCSMEKVAPSVLSSVVSNLNELCLENLVMNDDQCAVLFSSLSKLSTLNVQEIDLSRVPSALITPAAKLTNLKLSSTLLTPEQTSLLWNAIGKEGNFSTLQLTGVNLGAVNPEALADTARSALKIGFCNAGLTGEQTNAVANALAENTKIEEVDLSDNSLTNIDPALLARAVARTKNLNLANAELSSHQLKEILEALLSHDCVMNEINLSANEISMIDPDLMSKSLNKMTFVTLFDSNISVYQVWDQCFM